MRSPSPSWISGTLTTPCADGPMPPPATPDRPTPTSASTLSSTGRFVTIRYTPPSAPVPYKGPCGPFSISTRATSTSRRAGSAPSKAMRASSSWTLTGDWLKPLKTLSAIPRRNSRSAPGPAPVSVRPSTARATSRVVPIAPPLTMPGRRIATGAGMVDMTSSRLRPVTTMSGGGACSTGAVATGTARGRKR